MHQVELEIFYCILPSLSHNSQNSLQGFFRRVQSRFCLQGFEGTLSVDCNLEALYLSVLDFEYRT
jgi:hypothetical protein